MTDDDIELEIQAKDLNAPRLNPTDVENTIVDECYHVFPETTTTACLLTLANGYTVLGKSGCASRENFDEELGRKIARDDAKRQIWALEGYLLRQRLFEAQL